MEGGIDGENVDIETTELHYAARTGDATTIQAYCQPGVLTQEVIDSLDGHGKTALIFACFPETPHCLTLLLDAGASIDTTDSDGKTALHWAAFNGRHKAIKVLLERGISVNSKDAEGRTALHMSTGSDSSKCTKLILKYLTSESIDEADSESMTAAHWCAFHDHVKHMDLLVEAGANLMLPDREGRLPIHWTSSNTTQSTCNLILVSAIDSIVTKDHEGRTALHLAVANNNSIIVDILSSVEGADLTLQDNMMRTALHWAAVLGFESLTKLLLHRGANYAIPDAIGATALHYAAQCDQPECLIEMMQFSEIVDVPDHEGRSVVMWAAGKGLSASVEILAKHKFDLQAFDKTGATALHVTSFAGFLECTEMLLKYGAGVDALDSSHHTPLFRACEAGHLTVVDILIQSGSNVNALDVDKRSSLHWAALGGYDIICMSLIDAGATIDSVDKQGRSALHCATYGGHIKCMEILLRSGKANVDLQDHDGVAPLHWACSTGVLASVKLLLEDYKAYPNHLEVDSEKLSPLDYATMAERTEDYDAIIDLLLQFGALTFESIKNMAAINIQAMVRGHNVRKKLRRMTAYDVHAPFVTDSGLVKPELIHTPTPLVSSKISESVVSKLAPVDPIIAAAERLKILTQSASIKKQSKNERERIMRIRTMNKAAMIIQLAVRRWLRRRQSERALQKKKKQHRLLLQSNAKLNPQTALVKLVSNKASEALDMSSWKAQIAALTIQLAWRQYLRKKEVKAVTSRKKILTKVAHPWAPSLLAEKQRMNVASVYGAARIKKAYMSPKPKAMVRPVYMISRQNESIVSFHQAIARYTQPPIPSPLKQKGETLQTSKKRVPSSSSSLSRSFGNTSPFRKDGYFTLSAPNKGAAIYINKQTSPQPFISPRDFRKYVHIA